MEEELTTVYDDVAAARTRLGEEYAALEELEAQFKSLDLSPEELIAVVERQAEEAGLSLFTFLTTAPATRRSPRSKTSSPR